ncbi:MAG: MBL fold metallo-hydrolase [Candidatus Neomarinimicrobiota bacterium]
MSLLIMLLAVSWLSALGIRQYQIRKLVPKTLVENATNYSGRKFFNQLPSDELSFKNFMRMTAKYFRVKNPDKRPARPLPVIPINDQFNRVPSNDLRFAWLGHSSLILEIAGKRLLIDPMLSERSSMVQWAGPRRFHPAPLKAEELPVVDAVLISHDHFDHLDQATIKSIAGRDLLFIVPIGISSRLRDWGVAENKIIEMNWWDEYDLDGLRIVATPARHFSGRGLPDRDLTLWTSWSIIGEKRRVFFSGDTGPTPDMQTIGEKFGPFDLTFIEIGAYDETWASIHAGPVVAAQIHRQLNGAQMVPIHWATFDLALHSWYSPAEELVREAATGNIHLLTPRPGELVIPDQHRNDFWWRKFMNDPEFSPGKQEYCYGTEF